MKIKNNKIFNYIDLFAGAGGLSEGFIRQECFNPLAHIEMQPQACDTLTTRLAYHFLKNENQLNIYNDYLKGNINCNELWNILPEYLKNSVIHEELSFANLKKVFLRIDTLIKAKSVDLIIGGPPCQAYSVVGRSRVPDKMKNDPRNFLYKIYLEFLKKYSPLMFIFENVPGLLSAQNGEYFKSIQNEIKTAGYTFGYKILNAKDFGVLQDRKRVIIIGWKNKLFFDYPDFEKTENKYTVLEDLLYDLPFLKPGDKMQLAEYIKPNNEYLKKYKIRNCDLFTTQHIARPHNDRDLEIYKIAIEKWLKNRKRLNYTELPAYLQTHSNKTSFLNRFQVVNPFGVSHTVVAHIAMDGHYYIYPDLKQVRSISVREAARIQSFPDNYFFEGSRTAAFKQIGNAVPPLMAEGIAKKIKNYLI